eukprot:Colp12_sorted_trinity150504_noHs@8934
MGLHSLPPEILLMIMSRLPPSSLRALLCASRFFQGLKPLAIRHFLSKSTPTIFALTNDVQVWQEALDGVKEKGASFQSGKQVAALYAACLVYSPNQMVTDWLLSHIPCEKPSSRLEQLADIIYEYFECIPLPGCHRPIRVVERIIRYALVCSIDASVVEKVDNGINELTHEERDSVEDVLSALDQAYDGVCVSNGVEPVMHEASYLAVLNCMFSDYFTPHGIDTEIYFLKHYPTGLALTFYAKEMDHFNPILAALEDSSDGEMMMQDIAEFLEKSMADKVLQTGAMYTFSRQCFQLQCYFKYSGADPDLWAIISQPLYGMLIRSGICTSHELEMFQDCLINWYVRHASFHQLHQPQDLVNWGVRDSLWQMACAELASSESEESLEKVKELLHSRLHQFASDDGLESAWSDEMVMYSLNTKLGRDVELWEKVFHTQTRLYR